MKQTVVLAAQFKSFFKMSRVCRSSGTLPILPPFRETVNVMFTSKLGIRDKCGINPQEYLDNPAMAVAAGTATQQEQQEASEHAAHAEASAVDGLQREPGWK